MPQALYILFGAVFTVAVSTALGTLLLRKLPLDRAEQYVLGFVAGAPLLSTLVFLLCAVNLARKGVFLAAGLAILVASRRIAVSPRRRVAASIPRHWKVLFLVLFTGYAILYLSNAMAPEISPDGSTYHLGLVARYLREHGFHRLTTNMYANLSQGVEMLFLFAFAFGRHSAAAMVHFAFLLALPLVMLLYGRRFNLIPAGVCGALFVFVSPLAGIDGISAYIDVAVACIAFALFYLLQVWEAERSPALLVPIGLLAGFAYAAKYTAALAVPYAIGFVVWKCRRGRKPVLKPAATIAVCALLMMVPWMAKNWAWVRNPFSPFLNSVFPNPYIQAGFERDYSRYMRHYETIHSYRELPWAVTVDGRLSGFLGPLFLLSPVALLALRRREGRHLLLAASVFGVTYAFNIGARFLLPALPFVTLALALALVRWKPLAVALVLAHAVISWPAVTSLYCAPAAWRLQGIPWKPALRLEQEDSFLDARLSTYRMARLIERTVPRGAKVFSLSQVAEAYTTRNILVAYQASSNEVLKDILWTPLVRPFTPDWMLRFRFPPQPARRIRVVQTATSPTDQWSVSELRVYSGGSELARAPGWRLHAEPNPWDIQLAFDNTPVTRWRTWESIHPGEFVQVDFGGVETIDAVLLQCARDQYKVRVKLEAQDAGGAWRTLSEAPEESQGPSIPQLRRMATEELKLRGISYLVVYHYDFGKDDFISHPDQWGITPVGAQGEDRLYRID